MHSFYGFALRNIRARRLRVLLTTLGVVFGTGMILGVLLLTHTMNETYTSLYDSIYGRTDLVVSGKSGTGLLPQRDLEKIRRLPGVRVAQGTLLDVFSYVKDRGKVSGQSGQVNVSGFDTTGPDLSSFRLEQGHEPVSSREINLEFNWAKDRGIKEGQTIRLATPSGVAKFRVVGLFQFGTGLSFGGQGFATIPLSRERKLTDQPSGFSEIDIAVDSPNHIPTIKRQLKSKLGSGVQVATPASKTEQIQDQLKGFNIILYFFAAMALFVGSFIIFNSFSMTVLQRIRELGMLRTLGARRAMVVRSVMLEAILLGVIGSAIGIALGLGLAELLIAAINKLGFPVGELKTSWPALVVTVVAGVIVTLAGAIYPAVRAGRIAPIRAVLGDTRFSSQPSRHRAVFGVVALLLGLAGVYILSSSDSAPPPVAAAGGGGVVLLFLGVAMLAPILVRPMLKVISWPLVKLVPVAGRMAADSASANPIRTGATASALTIGLALVGAFGALGSSFLHTINSQIDTSLARDFTVQPDNFNPGGGPQQSISNSLIGKISNIDGIEVVTPERFLFLPDLSSGGGIAFGVDPKKYKELDNTQVEGTEPKERFAGLERGEVTVGSGLARIRHYKVGQTITLKGASAKKRVRIAAIVKTVIFGGHTIGMSLKTMREVYGFDTNSTLAVKLNRSADQDLVKSKMDHALKSYPQLTVLSNADLKTKIQKQVNQQFSIFYGILAMAVIISLFGIINTLLMNVLERTREIGLLRALGSSRWQIRRTVGCEGLMLALLGAILGVVVGLALGFVFVKGLTSLVPDVSYRPPIAITFGVAAAAVVLGLLASIIPARRAARLNIISALSYE